MASGATPGGVKSIGRALLAGVVCALLTTAPFVFHLADALPGGRLTAAGQRAFWLPWQLYANVVSGRGINDSSGFVVAPDVGLHALVGNPSTALLLAPLHALGAPVLAHNAGLFLLVATNAAGAWAVGQTLRPKRVGPLAAVLVGGAGWLLSQLGDGALAAAWVGPGLATVAALRSGRSRVALVPAVFGLIGAPLVTAAALAAGALLPRAGAARPSALGPVLGIAAILLGLAAPATTAGGPVSLAPSVVLWLGSGASIGLPVAFVLGLGALWSRGARWSRGTLGPRLAVVGVVVALATAIGPLARGVDGETLSVAGFGVPVAVAVPHGVAQVVVAHAREVVSGALLIGIAGALGWATRARRSVRLAALVACLAEPALQARIGQPVALWTGRVWPVPTALRALGERPYRGAILELPLLDVTEGLVGFIPFHRQYVSGVPGQQEAGEGRRALEQQVASLPMLGRVSRLGEGASESWELGQALREGGYGWLLIAGPSPALRNAVQHALGAPDSDDASFMLWDSASVRGPAGMKAPGWGGP